MSLKLGIHWFRQDLRLAQNPALNALTKKVDKILPIYIVDPKQRMGSVSKWWLEKSLKSLSDIIEKKNGKLNIFFGNPFDIITSFTCLLTSKSSAPFSTTDS